MCEILVLAAAAVPFCFLSKFVVVVVVIFVGVVDLLVENDHLSSPLPSSSSHHRHRRHRHHFHRQPRRHHCIVVIGIVITVIMIVAMIVLVVVAVVVVVVVAPIRRLDLLLSDRNRRLGTASDSTSPKSALVAPPCEGPRTASDLKDFIKKLTIDFDARRTSVFDPLGPASRERPLRAFLSYVCSRFNDFHFRDAFASIYQPRAPNLAFALFIRICLSLLRMNMWYHEMWCPEVGLEFQL